ncbi:single-strand binding protein [Actinocorallia herbida]|uniref:Single-stranded DNA-binding protein n=1 Tax=Actinocorallia herbida TaxID=58109 RepID=A0A3N1CMU4_9ACTN|nr:single-stranded DNA-binding protein [Actinocorallia herbida]ROO82623.1 single-strand binding protein [Actinocorallia herbida]
MPLPTLSGTARLTRDIDLRFTTSGVPVATIGLAFNNRRLNEQTKQWEDTDVFFVDATIWKAKAEACAEQLRTGVEVVVSGRMKSRQWETREGEKRWAQELILDSIGLAVRPPRNEGGGAQGGYAQRSDNGPRPQSGPQDDPWATPAAAGGHSGGYSDEPPF